MLLHLAERFGMTVAELEWGRGTPMPARELAEWEAEEQIRAEERLHRELDARARAAMRAR